MDSGAFFAKVNTLIEKLKTAVFYCSKQYVKPQLLSYFNDVFAAVLISLLGNHCCTSLHQHVVNGKRMKFL